MRGGSTVAGLTHARVSARLAARNPLGAIQCSLVRFITRPDSDDRPHKARPALAPERVVNRSLVGERLHRPPPPRTPSTTPERWDDSGWRARSPNHTCRSHTETTSTHSRLGSAQPPALVLSPDAVRRARPCT